MISLPVCGLRPFLAGCFVVENVPKPTNDIRSPFYNASADASMNASSAFLASTFVIPAFSAMTFTNSALFILIQI